MILASVATALLVFGCRSNGADSVQPVAWRPDCGVAAQHRFEACLDDHIGPMVTDGAAEGGFESCVNDAVTFEKACRSAL